MAHQDTTVDKPSHTPGTPRGEELAKPQAQRPTRKAHDASGVNPDDRKPIHPKMPHLPPA
jgi:hypothetical protein